MSYGQIFKMILTNIQHNYRCTSSTMEHPHISVDMWQSTWMGSFLTDELATVVCMSCHWGHQTSLLKISMNGVTWKTWCMNAKLTEDRNYILELLILKDAWIILMFYISFRSSRSSNIHSSVTTENQTHVHTTFVTGNDPRNKIMTYWQKVTGHPNIN